MDKKATSVDKPHTENEKKNKKITNNEFTSAAAEAKAHELLQQTRNEVSWNTTGKNRSPCKELLETQSGTRGEKLCSQLPSPVHSRKRIDMHEQKFGYKVKARIVEKNGINIKLGDQKRITRTSTALV